METNLRKFAEESNRIEGIDDVAEHYHALQRLKELLMIDELTIDHIIKFNTAGEVRENHGMDVRVGNYYPPKGNANMRMKLEALLKKANNEEHPYLVHVEFETLHPFMDGNGRTGRAIWLWQMRNQHYYDISLGFLHMYYYQSLDKSRA